MHVPLLEHVATLPAVHRRGMQKEQRPRITALALQRHKVRLGRGCGWCAGEAKTPAALRCRARHTSISNARPASFMLSQSLQADVADVAFAPTMGRSTMLLAVGCTDGALYLFRVSVK